MTGRLGGDVLRRLRDAGPQTKSQLAEFLGVPRTTLTATLRSLTAAGLLEDGPVAPSSGGRRSVTVRMTQDRVALALSLGERRVRVAVLDGHLAIGSGVSIDLQGRGSDPESISATVQRASEQVLAGRVPSAIGIAAAEGSPLAPEDLTGFLADDFPGTTPATLPAVRAMALGEHHSGEARGVDDFLAVRLGGTASGGDDDGGTPEHGRDRPRRRGRAPAGRGVRAGLRVWSHPVPGLVRQLRRTRGAGDRAVAGARGRSPALADALTRSGALDLGDLVAAGRAGRPRGGAAGP